MRSRKTLYAALAYLAITIAITYPLIGQLSTHIAGLPENDSLEFVWSTWWFKHSLLDLHNNPINISVLNYPTGLQFPLLPSMSQSFLLALPLAAVFSPVVAFNVVYLLSFLACALAGYWLCYDLTQDRRAAFLGGLIWGFFPSKSAHAMAGHLFQMVVFMLPIATLFLLRALRTPTRKNAIVAGVTLAIAATIHPVNVAYFLIPVVIVVVAFALWDAYRPSLPGGPSPKVLWITLIFIGITGGLLSLPIFLPTFLSHDLGFLVERGLVGLSLDALTFILPSPYHPWLINTPLGDYIRKVNFQEFEHVAYLGLVGLTLSVIGARWHWRASRIWVVLGIATIIFSLGPELHIGRELVSLPVETDKVPILLPYAWLNALPFLQWSRTPGRLNETTILAVMILAAYGTTTVLGWIKSKQAATAVWLVACLVIPIEYLERWPLPMMPVPASPALAQMANDTSFTAVLNYPITRNSINLLDLVEQTVHQHPIIGGRVYRDQPGGLWVQDFMYTLLRTPVTGDDIAPLPTVEQRTAGLAYYGVGRVVYQPDGDDGKTKMELGSILGAPLAVEDLLSVYAVPPTTKPVAPYIIFGPNWYAAEQWQAPTRWFNGDGFAYLFTPTDTTSALRFTAIPGQDMRRLIIKVNGQEIAHFVVGDWADYETPAINFKAGHNMVEFYDEDGSWQYVGDPRCQHGSAIAGPFPYEVPCDGTSHEGRALSLAIQNVQLVPATTPPVQTSFSGKLNLLQVTGPNQAKAGEAITYHFIWQAPAVPDQDYTMFVHVLDAKGQLVVGNDSAPVHGNYPTTRWLANQTVAYNVALSLPTDLPAGDYSVEIGWYVWPSLERLTLGDGSTIYSLGSIKIKP